MRTSPIATHTGAGGPLFGRERELVALDELVDGLPRRGGARLVRGKRGNGKSVDDFAVLTVLAYVDRAGSFFILHRSVVAQAIHLPSRSAYWLRCSEKEEFLCKTEKQ